MQSRKLVSLLIQNVYFSFGPETSFTLFVWCIPLCICVYIYIRSILCVSPWLFPFYVYVICTLVNHLFVPNILTNNFVSSQSEYSVQINDLPKCILHKRIMEIIKVKHIKWLFYIEGKIKGEMEVTRRRGRRRKKLLDDLKDRRGYPHLTL